MNNNNQASFTFQNLHLHTPSQYAAHIEKTFRADNCKVVDFYAVPDYHEFLKACVDSKFSRYCKQEFTQHQFIFESVEKSDYFPLGCRTTYRAYASDAVVEIKKQDNPSFPKIPMVAFLATPIRNYPLPVVNADNEEIHPGGTLIIYCKCMLLIYVCTIYYIKECILLAHPLLAKSTQYVRNHSPKTVERCLMLQCLQFRALFVQPILMM